MAFVFLATSPVLDVLPAVAAAVEKTGFKSVTRNSEPAILIFVLIPSVISTVRSSLLPLYVPSMLNGAIFVMEPPKM